MGQGGSTRYWGYGRVSTTEQDTGNQRLEIEAAGFKIPPGRWAEDHGVSGGVMAMERPAFAKLVGRMKDSIAQADEGEGVRPVLVVSKLDRLGRDAIDVQTTVRDLAAAGVGVVVLNLGKETDLTTAAGKLLLTMLAAVAEMERDLIRERTRAGLERAKAEGKVLGRKPVTTQEKREQIRERLRAGESITEVARALGVSRGTIYNVRDGA